MATKSQTPHKKIYLNRPMKEGGRGNGSLVNFKFSSEEKDILRPVDDFKYDSTEPNNFEPTKVLIADGTVYALGEDDNNDIAIYNISTSSSGSEGDLTFEAGSGTGIDRLSDAEYYENDDGKFIYLVDTGGDISRYNLDTNTFDLNVNTSFSAGATSALNNGTSIVYNHIDDKLYFLTGNEINYLDNVTFSTDPFVLNKSLDYNFIFTYDRYIGVIGAGNGKQYVQFWDRDTSKTTLSKSLIVDADRVGAVGIIEGKLMLIVSKATYGNTKEYEGVVSVLGYTGSGFNTKITDLFINDEQATMNFNGIIDNEFYLYIAGNNDNYVNKNGLYRINSNGDIRMVNSASTDSSNDKFYSSVKRYNIFYSAMRYDDGLGNKYAVGLIYDRSGGFDNFDKESEYITEVMMKQSIRNQMTEFVVGYQKLYDGDELGKFYYRTSQLDDWTLLGTVDYGNENKTGRANLYRKKFKTPTLPEFNEIQFKFTSKNGFTLLEAGFNYLTKDYE